MFQPICLMLPPRVITEDYTEPFPWDPDVLSDIITHIGPALLVTLWLGSLHESARSKRSVEDFPVLQESAVISFWKACNTGKFLTWECTQQEHKDINPFISRKPTNRPQGRQAKIHFSEVSKTLSPALVHQLGNKSQFCLIEWKWMDLSKVGERNGVADTSVGRAYAGDDSSNNNNRGSQVFHPSEKYTASL